MMNYATTLPTKDEELYEKVISFYRGGRDSGSQNIWRLNWVDQVLDALSTVVVHRFRHSEDIRWNQLTPRQKTAVTSLIATGFLKQVDGQIVVSDDSSQESSFLRPRDLEASEASYERYSY